jgi:PAS domain S-box
MDHSIIFGLIQNLALLLVLSVLYDYFWARNENTKNIFYKVGAGITMGIFGILLMLSQWTVKSGLFFDTRSVILAISGLFFGPLPTIIAMFFMGTCRLVLGGPGAIMGVAVIISSGTVGILWCYFRPDWKKRNNLLELVGVGVLVHLVMLSCTVLLPIQIRIETIKNISIAILLIYPGATVLLGKMMIRQSINWENKKALLLSEDRWQFALEGAGDGVWDWNPKTNEIFFSKRWKSMLGYDEKDIENDVEEWKALLHEDEKEGILSLIRGFLTNEKDTCEIEYRLRCKDGTYKWVLTTGKIMAYDSHGYPVRCIGTNKDISDRKEKELLLARERFLVDSLMNFAPESIFFKDLDSRFIRINNASAHNMGFATPEEAIGKSDFDIFSKEYAEKTRFDELEVMRTGNCFSSEEQGQLADGTDVWVRTNKLPLLDSNGVVMGTFGVTIDITERKRTEQALIASEHYTNSILKAIPDLIFIINSEGVYLDFKTGNVDDLAAPKEMFLNKNVSEVLPESLAVLTKETIGRVLKEQRMLSIEYDLTVKSGSNTFESFIVPFGEDKVIAMVRNITAHKKVEKQLKRSKEQLKSFAAHLQHVREEERVVLAREIHDELGQILVALKIDMGMLRQQVSQNVNAKGQEAIMLKFDMLFKLVDKTIKTTRKIMTGLRPEALELMGISEAARLHTIEFAERYNIDCRYGCNLSELDIEFQQSIALFRILQESLNNVAKHSKATEVDVTLDIVENKIIMKVADNGIGIDLKNKHRKDSYGLIGMKERVYLLNGELTISGELGRGTKILVEMPYKSVNSN